MGLKRIVVNAITSVQDELLVSHAESQLSREYKDEFFAGEWSKLSE